jgi:hypothetical protein
MKDIERAIEAGDAFALSKLASKEDLDRIAAAEAVIEKRRGRTRLARFFFAGQALAAYIALAGFFANAYQNYSSRRDSEARSAVEQERWSREFKRAQDADKYRAFFETSSLVTDANTGKHVVGYTLLKEFVDDEAYASKALTLLETSLGQELRENTAKVGMDQERRVALTAIVAALGASEDCNALEKAARSVDRLTYRFDRVRDAEEVSEVFRMYVRHVFGGAAKNCKTLEDFERVHRPIRRALMKYPEFGSLKPPVQEREGSRRMGELLRDACEDEVVVAAENDCDQVFRGYQSICEQAKSDARARAEQQDVCDMVDKIVDALPAERAPQLTAYPSTQPQKTP